MTDLPDLSGLTAVSAAEWRTVGHRLSATGFDAAYCQRLWDASPDRYPGTHWPVHAWRVESDASPAGLVYRLFCLGAEVPADAIATALSSEAVGTLSRAGVLVDAGRGRVAALLDLRLHGGHFLLCDRPPLGGEAVFATGPGTTAFSGIASPAWAAGSGVDIGCGAGAAALTLSRHVRHVVGTDVNERAITVARANAALNGITTVEFRVGDLLEPIAGETYDVLIAQLPYVPAPPDELPATFQSGGALGTDVLARLVSGLSEHIGCEGRAGVVYELAGLSGAVEADPWTMLDGSGLEQLRLVGAPVEPDVYSVRYALPRLRDSTAAFDRAVVSMREHLHRMGITAIHPAMAVLRRAEEVGWTESLHVGGYLWDAIGPATLRRLLDGMRVARLGGDLLDAATVRIPAGTLSVRGIADGDEVHLVLPSGYLGEPSVWTEAEFAALVEERVTDRALKVRALRAGLGE